MSKAGDIKQFAQGVQLQEQTCFQNKSKFITEDYFVQHMNIRINKVNEKLYTQE